MSLMRSAKLGWFGAGDHGSPRLTRGSSMSVNRRGTSASVNARKRRREVLPTSIGIVCGVPWRTADGLM
jgi:hypothetical protein